MIKQIDYRTLLGTFATGVTIVTTSLNNQLFGFTANSFTSVSLEPALVLFCVKSDATFIDVLADSKVFGINILSSEQKNIATIFSNREMDNQERFKDATITMSELNCPVIKGSLAYLDCEQSKVSIAGDHLIVIGKVKSIERYDNDDPLIYFNSQYRRLKE